METTFLAYSKRFLIRSLTPLLPLNIQRSGARSVRVLWYLEEMGGGWLTMGALSNMGAGQWKAIQYAIPDLLKDNLIEEVQIITKTGKVRSKFKINAAGRQVLKVADEYVHQEYLKAMKRCEDFRLEKGIAKLTVGDQTRDEGGRP